MNSFDLFLQDFRALNITFFLLHDSSIQYKGFIILQNNLTIKILTVRTNKSKQTVQIKGRLIRVDTVC